MIETKDIHWLAGLLEGEGCFHSVGKHSAPRITIKMCDADVISRAGRLIRPVRYRQNGNSPALIHPRGNRKPIYVLTIAGRRAVGWMMTLYPLMGIRRQARIRELITEWRTRPCET